MKTIIVPTDFSAYAHNALKYALQFAMQAGCGIRLMHVVPPDAATTKTVEAEYLKNWYQKIRANISLPDNQVPVSFKISQGISVPEQILAEAKTAHASLIIMGTHGEGYLQQAFFGSNATNTLFRSDRPVLLVPAKCSYRHITKLVCASDMMNVTNELQYVSKLARTLVTDVEVLHLGYGFDKAEKKADFDKLVSTSYPNVVFRYKKMRADDPLVINLQHHLKHTKGELMVIFPKERGFLDKLLLNSQTERLCYQPGKPILAIRKYLLKPANALKADNGLNNNELENYLYNPAARTARHHK